MDACDEDVIPEILKGVLLFLHCRRVMHNYGLAHQCGE
jgi:hypothetical protein